MTQVPAGFEPRSGWLVGLNNGVHDAACALLKDGALVVSVEQERLSRRKRALAESPGRALRSCLDFAGIELADVDAVALGWDHAVLARWYGYDAERRRTELPYDSPGWLFPADVFGRSPTPPLVPVRHHVAHAGSCFWPSGFANAAILVMDAMGEDCSTSLAVGTPDGIEILESFPIDVSLGFFYETASEYAGLGWHNAGKLMGLAAYGSPTEDVGLEYGPAGPVWRPVPDSARRGRDIVVERTDRLLDHFERHCYPYTRSCREDTAAYADFAASAQHALQRVVLRLAERLRERSGCPDLVVAGGVGLNCTLNGALVASGLFDRVWVQPMAHDAGVALGSATVLAHALGQDVTAGAPMRHAYWGLPTDDAVVERELKRAHLRAARLELPELLSRTARVIADGGVVAWHQGRAEVGPRALGARSLLGDPRSRHTLVRLNRAKDREMWRPLAPSVLEERFGDFFDGVPNEFMIVAARVRPEVRRLIPAVVHVDGSARPQVVSAATNPAYAGLIREFDRLTGIPVIVNTSLNVADEPLCCAPRETIATFVAGGADALAIGPYFVCRERSADEGGH